VPLLAVSPKFAVDGATAANSENLDALLQRDWLSFKTDLYSGELNRTTAKTTKFFDYWSYIECHYKDRYPFLLTLILPILCLPIGTAECERIFSFMNRLKDQSHNRRSNATLRDLIMILCNGPKSLSDFEPQLDKFIDFWESLVERRHNLGL
jgi:hypothetical protein